MDKTTLGPPDPEPLTRPPMSWWDRAKFLVLFGGVWAVLVWNTYIELEVVGGTLGDAVREQLHSGTIWLFLAWVELMRQLHYLLSEHSSAWHGFWSRRVFGALNRRAEGLDDWNRYRLGRVLRVLGLLAVVGYVLGQVYDEAPTRAIFHLPATIWSALPSILQVLLLVSLSVLQFVAIFWFLSRGGVDVYMPNDIKTRFTDVWGQDAVLGRVKENLVFLDDPGAIEQRGGYVPSGILLWGPPGTGKTLLAESVAGETGKPFVFVEPGAFINMFFGVGVLKVKSLFRKLRKLAVRYGGVVVFFDEADALGSRGALASGGPGGWGFSGSGSWDALTACNGLGHVSGSTASAVMRSALSSGASSAWGDGDPPRRWRDRIVMGGGMGGGGMGTLQALLTELSGLKKPRGFFNRVVRRALGMRPKPPPKYRILVMMATNLPEALDEALLRPGRIDRIYKVGYPSKVGRIRTYEGYFAKVAHELDDEDMDKLATMTPYATGATIKDLVNEALINAIRDGREVINWKDVLKAKQLKDLGLPEDVEYVDRERHAVAVHEACHALVAHRMRHHLTIDIATIEKGSTYLGMVASIKPEDLFTQWRSEFEADIMVSLASLAGERLFFEGDSSSGVSGDLETATLLATYMEGYWGMGETIAVHGVSRQLGSGGGIGRPGGPGGGGGAGGDGRGDEAWARSHLGQRIEDNLRAIYDRTEELLRGDRVAILALAHALQRYKTLTGDDVRAVIDGTVGPLVDGRAYHVDGAAEALEDYHRRAVDAHTSHGRVGIELPDLGDLYFNGRAAAAPSNGSGNGGVRTRRRRSATGAG
jgi:cell division protease FtsH